MLLILRSHFLQFYHSLFLGWAFFRKNALSGKISCSEFDMARKRFLLENNVAFFAKMVDGTVDVDIAGRLKLPTNDVAKCIERVKKNVSQPTRVYYLWKSLLE